MRAKLILLVVSGLLAIVLLEVLLQVEERILHMMADSSTPAISVMDAVWDHGERPNATVTMAPQDGYPTFTYQTNSYGCRGATDPVVPKPEGLYRVVMLGDSFTGGYYAEDTVAVRLEDRLTEAFAPTPYEVINCGVSSYSPMLYYLRLKYQLAELEPDEIVVNVDMTDVFDDYWRYRLRAEFDDGGEPVRIDRPVPWRLRAMEELRYRFYLPRLLWGRITPLRTLFGANIPPAKPPTEENVFWYHATREIDSQEWRDAVGFSLETLRYLVEFARQRDIQVTLTTYPHKQQLQRSPDGEPLWHREVPKRIQALAQESGINYYSAYDAIAKAYAEGKELYWANDMHFTPLGQRTWANAVADYYVQRLQAEASAAAAVR